MVQSNVRIVKVSVRRKKRRNCSFVYISADAGESDIIAIIVLVKSVKIGDPCTIPDAEEEAVLIG
jgi:hypothetical protein